MSKTKSQYKQKAYEGEKQVHSVSVFTPKCNTDRKDFTSDNYVEYLDCAHSDSTLSVLNSDADYTLCYHNNLSNWDNGPINTKSIQEDSCKNTDLQSTRNLLIQLRSWAASHSNIPRSAINDLLHILSPLHPDLPLDVRTLLKTPVNFESKQLENGVYCHFGLHSYLIKYFMSYPIQPFVESIDLSFNIDGLPLFRSSSMQFWPILGVIKNIQSEPFSIGIFCGKSKPKPIDLYLKDFIDELCLLLQSGLKINNKNYSIHIHSFVCDAPARAYLKRVKSHTGYSACDKCEEQGEYINRRVVLRNLNATIRTDESFALKLDENYHLDDSPLVQLPIGLVSKFPIDYMHCVLLGVMRKLLNLWVFGSNLKVKLPHRVITQLSQKIVSLKTFIPKEINRKPRDLAELSHFKATEFRTFLIYIGPLVLYKVVDIAVYEHFLLLHCAITILCSVKHISNLSCNLASEFLKTFIQHSEKIYGPDFIVYNVHMLAHLSKDAEVYGPLDNFSAFPFETYLGQIKFMLKSTSNPLAQIYRRIKEKEISIKHFIDKKVSLEICHNLGPLLVFHKNVTQYKKIQLKDFVLTISSYSKSDCHCLIRSKLVRIDNIVLDSHGHTAIIGKEYILYEHFYDYPIKSDLLNIYKVRNSLSPLKCWNLDNIESKCLVFEFDKNILISFPLLHTAYL